jgi:hypothetical protein
VIVPAAIVLVVLTVTLTNLHFIRSFENFSVFATHKAIIFDFIFLNKIFFLSCHDLKVMDSMTSLLYCKCPKGRMAKKHGFMLAKHLADKIYSISSSMIQRIISLFSKRHILPSNEGDHSICAHIRKFLLYLYVALLVKQRRLKVQFPYFC